MDKLSQEHEKTTTESSAAAGGAPSMYAAAPSYTMHTAGKTHRPVLENASAESSYLFGSSGSFRRPAWSDSTGGRAIIRFISRGIVGAGFFTFGTYYANAHITNYEPEVYGKLNWENLRSKNILQTVARVIDAGPGRAIKKVFDESAVRFHMRENYHNLGLISDETLHLYNPQQLQKLQEHGRSLGAEIVQVTFNFFMGSIGDAMTRNIIQGMDPNVRQPWFVDDKGHPTGIGHGTFRFDKWLQAFGRSSWRILSKNAGEDWAAALPYVYQMKWQRQAINNMGRSPDSITGKLGMRGIGFKSASDGNMNGALADVNEHGLISKEYQWAGALDLHSRFIGYNWYTLMYREAYDTVARGFKDWRKNNYAVHLPEVDNPIAAAGHAITQTARYVTKSFIKANLYMQPAVIPFWMMRVPQSKWRGRYMAQEVGAGSNIGGKPDYDYLRTQNGGFYPRAKLIHDNNWAPDAYLNGKQVFNFSSTDPNFIKNIENPHAFGLKRSVFDAALNPFGALSFKAGSGLTHVVDKIFQQPGKFTQTVLSGTADLNPNNMLLSREKMLRNFVDTGMAYYPYMWLKAETALRVDDRKNGQTEGRMDHEIYNLIDSAVRFRAQDTWQAVKNIAHLATREEKELISREGGYHAALAEQERKEQAEKEMKAAMDAAKKPLPSEGPSIVRPTTQIQASGRAHVGQATPQVSQAANDHDGVSEAPSIVRPLTHVQASGRERVGQAVRSSNDNHVNDNDHAERWAETVGKAGSDPHTTHMPLRA